jgi:hypothetical protein
VPPLTCRSPPPPYLHRPPQCRHRRECHRPRSSFCRHRRPVTPVSPCPALRVRRASLVVLVLLASTSSPMSHRSTGASRTTASIVAAVTTRRAALCTPNVPTAVGRAWRLGQAAGPARSASSQPSGPLGEQAAAPLCHGPERLMGRWPRVGSCPVLYMV